jgi:small subunit ribosomal protein S6
MFLLDSNRYGRDPEGVAGQVPEMIRGAGGKVLVSRLWEERRLAYPIKGRRKGTYWLTYFRMEGSKLADLRRRSQLNDNVLRELFLKIDPRLVDTLVAHAQPGEAESAPEADKKTAAEGGPAASEKGKAPADKKKEQAAVAPGGADQPPAPNKAE